MLVYAIEYMPGHVELGSTDNLSAVVERLEPELTVTRPRRIYTHGMTQDEAREALATLEALCSEHGYSIPGKNKPEALEPGNRVSRYAVDMIALHAFYRKCVPCQMFGANPWDSSGNKLHGIPLKSWVVPPTQVSA